MNKQLVKRLKSLLWRAGAVGLIAGLSAIAEGLGAVGLPIWTVGVLGLVLGEITKFLNNLINR